MDAVETMFSVREVPWHGLGEIVKEAPTSAEALKLAGLDWNVRLEPVKWNDVETGYFMTVRDLDEKVLGVVGGRYKPVQNEEAFAFMDELLGEGLTYETAGSLCSGKRVWMLAKMPKTTILGDDVEPYMVLTNNHDGFGSLKVAMTPIRVVCNNTLNLALDTSKRIWNVRHTGSIEDKVMAAKQTLGLSMKYIEDLKVEADDLYQIKLSNSKYQSIKEKLFPITEDMSTRKEESQVMLRNALDFAYERADIEQFKGTGWGFINAVSDLATHKRPARLTENYKENNFMSTIDAPNMLDEALKLIHSVR